jgi:hypothetical protein
MPDNEAMELTQDCYRAYTAAEWQAVWGAIPKPDSRERHLKSPTPYDRVVEAAVSAGERLRWAGFTHLTNGGLPLLKRYRGPWIDEILFHAPTTGQTGSYAPVSIEIIVSLRELEAVRVKYSRSCMMVSPLVAVANLGDFELPPSHILWNVERESSRVEIARRLGTDALDWLEALADPVVLEDRVASRTLPLVDDVTGLEMVLALGGRNAARRIVKDWWADSELAPRLRTAKERLSHHLGPVYRGEDPDLNLGSLCLCFDLWPSPLPTVSEILRKN